MKLIRRRLGCLLLAAALLCSLIPAALAAEPEMTTPEEIPVAEEEVVTPEEETTVPEEEVTAPEEGTVPGEDVTTPEEEVTTPEEEPSDTMLPNFIRTRTCEPGRFTDVAENSWYAGNVKTAYELNLTSGTGANTFGPGSNMSVAMTVALAARLHSIYHTGSADALVQGEPWYQVYVDYALANGIIEEGQFEDYNADAARAQCAVLLSRAIPAEELEAVNTVEDGAIPDSAKLVTSLRVHKDLKIDPAQFHLKLEG